MDLSRIGLFVLLGIYFNSDINGITTHQIARICGIRISSIGGIFRGLLKRGYIEWNPANKWYEITPIGVLKVRKFFNC
jgi:DNA-binding IclR family transcriptional regulator